ncbi:transmembrane protein 237-like [Watersipora subatra]|uniref:transmembrane protein 237-like n=1 Tax=Watersipora subatra TaxID=2589382 RepID=UPI00355BBFD6
MTQTQRRKKKPQNVDGSLPSLQHGLSPTESGRDDLSQSNATLNGSSKPRKKRKRKPAATAPSPGTIDSLGINLADIQDDIIDEATDVESDNAAQPPHRKHMKSQPIGKLYIEQSRGFKSADKKVIDDLYLEEQRKKENMEDEEAAYPTKLSSIGFALISIQVIKTFAHFCMGILAGLATWQTFYAFSLSTIEDTEPFLKVYQFMSIPINCVFYILIVFCTVATFDRYDVSKVTKPCLLKACTLQSGAVTALLYTTALCINVSMAPIDDRLGPRTNGTTDSIREFTKDEEVKELNTWRILSLVRTLLVGLAWFIIALRPSTDRLTKNIGESELNWDGKEIS